MSDPSRDTWNNKVEYLLTAVGYCVGLGNVWRFPFICQKYGGGSFIIPYLIMVAIAGVPAFLLEATLGQFSSQGPVNAFNGIKILKGLGFAMLAVCIFVGVYYNVVISWIGYYIFQSFNKVLPWTECNESWANPQTCASTFEEATKSANASCMRSPTESFYYENVLGLENVPDCETSVGYGKVNVTEEVDGSNTTVTTEVLLQGELINVFEFGGFQMKLVLFLIIAWVIIGLCVGKGVKTSGKLMYVITLFPYFAMTVLFLRGVVMPGAGNGLKYLFNPPSMTFSSLFSLDLWLAAIGQIFFSTSIALGGVHTLASFSAFRNNVIKDTYIIVLADTLTSVYGAMTVFVYLGAMAESMQMPIEDVVQPGPGLVFIVWPEAMGKLSQYWVINSLFAITFFAMLYFMGVSSMISLTETVVSFVTDYNTKLREKRPLVVTLVCLGMLVPALPMVTKNGIYFFDVVDTYASALNLVILATIEIICLSWIYGKDRLMNDLKMMTPVSSGVEKAYKIFWSYVVPVLNCGLLIKGFGRDLNGGHELRQHGPMDATYQTPPFPHSPNRLLQPHPKVLG